MPFGLKNTPSTFQVLMNHLSHIRKFVLIFFNNILMDDHIEHLWMALTVLHENQLFAKCSKCKFGCLRVDCLGHIIFENGISVNPNQLFFHF